MKKIPIFAQFWGNFQYILYIRKMKNSRQDTHGIFSFGHFCDPLGMPNQKILVPNPGIFFFGFHKFFDTVIQSKKRNQTRNLLLKFFFINRPSLIWMPIRLQKWYIPESISESTSDRRHTKNDVKIFLDILQENSIQVGKSSFPCHFFSCGLTGLLKRQDKNTY